jgi:glycine dehydrogenase subunit 1
MDVSNASMYDGATALAESMLMATGIKRRGKVLVSRAIPPRARAVLQSYAVGKRIEIVEVPLGRDGATDLEKLDALLDDATAAVLLAQPNYLGLIEDAESVARLAHGAGSLLVAYVDPVSLAVLAPPGRYDADIAVGEGQPFGNPQNFGGPLLGFMATKAAYVRKCPGRLISGAVDNAGKRGYVMTLQTREQHIRREKATSNICTNEGLCALAAAVYLTALGERGVREVAVQSMAKSHTLYSLLGEVRGATLPFGDRFFQEFVVDFGAGLGGFTARARANGLLPGIPLADDYPELGTGALLVAVTEKRTRGEIETYRDIAAGKGGAA